MGDFGVWDGAAENGALREGVLIGHYCGRGHALADGGGRGREQAERGGLMVGFGEGSVERVKGWRGGRVEIGDEDR